MLPELITSYKEECKEFVPEQFKLSKKLLGFLDILFEQCNFLERGFWEIFTALNISIAEGLSLDFIGNLVGLTRTPGESDESYRSRILSGRIYEGAPAPEVLRNIISILVGGKAIGLFPVWPAAMYVVVDGSTDVDFASVEAQYMTSGCALGRGTFICGEPDNDASLFDFGYLVDEDHGQPIVCDYRMPDTIYAIVDSSGYIISDDEEAIVVGTDYLTTAESVET